MTSPTIKSGRFHAGRNLRCGENVVVDVTDEVVLGDNCTLGDNTYLSGRKVVIGDHFYGYSWEWRRLDVGRGRRDCQYATLEVGNRCTFHDNRIDLARSVTIGHDVGLSPEVAIYTHGYWMDPREGFPCEYEPVTIGNEVIVGFRSVILPGANISGRCVIGAQSVVRGRVGEDQCGGSGPVPGVYAGNPAKLVRPITMGPGSLETRAEYLGRLTAYMEEYVASLHYRGYARPPHNLSVTRLVVENGVFDLVEMTYAGTEDEFTDDLRWFLFTHGLRIYTDRPFAKLEGKYEPEQDATGVGDGCPRTRDGGAVRARRW